jgi:dCMP deaminase
VNWTEYHMGFAQHAAKKSKDPSTQVGAVAIGPLNQIVETGYNGLPRGVEDKPERMERPAKYTYTSHAEENLVAIAARPRLAGTTVYVTHICCSRCARMLIQAGVSKVVSGPGTTSMPQEEFDAAIEMFSEAGVEVEYVDA